MIGFLRDSPNSWAGFSVALAFPPLLHVTSPPSFSSFSHSTTSLTFVINLTASLIVFPFVPSTALLIVISPLARLAVSTVDPDLILVPEISAPTVILDVGDTFLMVVDPSVSSVSALSLWDKGFAFLDRVVQARVSDRDQAERGVAF